MIDRPATSFLIRPSGVAVPVHPAITLTPDTALTPFRAQFSPPVVREFKSLDEIDAFLDEGWSD